VFAVVFVIGLFALSSSLDRKGIFDTSSPLAVLNNWLELSVKWNVYQIERESGWVQKLFDEMPEGLRLPFVAVYGILQPVLPATLVVPTIPIWKIIYLLRALGWYALLPLMILSFVAGSTSGFEKKRTLFVWLALLAWTWILLAALRGGGDQWDNPRYRTLLFMWQALVGGYVWVWWRESRSVWFARVVVCEAVFLLVFTQWYASRYFYVGGQLPFAMMIALIIGLWGVILVGGWWLDRRRVQPSTM
jgi:peptidoglycan/LPS O-acetylase OafA/YrhL